MKSGFTRFFIGILLLLAAACAQQPIYTLPYVPAEPAVLNPPLAVTLAVTYSKDGKRDAKREQELTAQLTDAFASSTAFKLTDATSAVGKLSIAVEDNATTKHRSLLGTISVSLGNVLVGQSEFTPQGRRTIRALDVDISYTPGTGAAQSQVYTSQLVTVTNNTQDPTDLVPMQDRKHAELALIGNDINVFAAQFQKSTAPATP